MRFVRRKRKNKPPSPRERDLAAILDRMPVGAVELSSGGVVTLANEMARQFLTFQKDHEGHERLDLAAMDPITEDGEPVSLEKTPFQRATKRRRPVHNVLLGIQSGMWSRRAWIQVNAEPVFDESGAVSSVMMSFTDVSQRKYQEEMIKKQQAELVHASRFSGLGIMAGGMAHEINNPLAVIKGRLELLGMKCDGEDIQTKTVKDEIAIISRNADRIADVVRTMRQFAGDARMGEIEKVSVSQIVETALTFCRQRLANHGIQLFTEDLAQDLSVECNWVEITQVLFNVLRNAHDAVEGRDHRWIRLTVSDMGTGVEFEVADSGPGIPEDVREKILWPFFTTKPPGKGTGLGLSVAKRLVENHGGTIHLDTECGDTTFRILIPKSQKQLRARHDSAA